MRCLGLAAHSLRHMACIVADLAAVSGLLSLPRTWETAWVKRTSHRSVPSRGRLRSRTARLVPPDPVPSARASSGPTRKMLSPRNAVSPRSGPAASKYPASCSAARCAICASCNAAAAASSRCGASERKIKSATVNWSNCMLDILPIVFRIRDLVVEKEGMHGLHTPHRSSGIVMPRA